MQIKIRTTLLLICAAMTAITLSAQDLSSQRGESQNVSGLFGEKINYTAGFYINPTPQELTLLDSPKLDISKGVKLLKEAKAYTEELSFLTADKKGAPLRIELLKKGKGNNYKEGYYSLIINNKGVNISAYEDLGIFYAIQSLRQIVESPAASDGTLPAVDITDAPDLHYRGVVEGFYGTPWSHQTRLSLIDTYGRYKMNYYIYGPKDDPYHSSPNWRLAYPEAEAKNIAELVEACKKNRVNFVWAIHPGKDIKWNEEDYQNLVKKFDMMYDLGVRAFAIHFDDIEGEGTNPLRQTELLNRLNEEFVKVKGDVASLIVCPTDYTRLWANPTERGSLVKYGNTLDPSVDVFWTGDAVCSNLTEGTMEWVNSRIKRPALYWWNYPVTDYARHILMQGPVYGLATTMTDEKVRGLVSNPMEHGEASKLALYSVADYTWNTSAYNPIDSWERALETLAPEVKEAYRLFAIHSCDTETGYRRVESWETETFTLDSYDAAVAERLKAELNRIVRVPEQMQAMENKALLKEIEPWLVEFGKLGERCLKAIECLELYLAGEYDAFWNLYIDNLMSVQQVEEYDAHRVGTMKLKPFYERLMDDMAAAYYESQTGNKASTLTAIGSYRTLQAPQAKYMFDSDPETYFHSGQAQHTDDCVAVDMGIVREVRKLRIIQGRNSVDDVDYFDHAIVEYSTDGESWTALTEPLIGVYEIEWEGEPIEARYIALRKLESTKRNWVAVRAFEVNPVAKEEYATDENPYTALEVSDSATFTIPADKHSATLFLGKLGKDAAYRLLDSDGSLINEAQLTSSLTSLELNGATQIEVKGVRNIYEVVFK